MLRFLSICHLPILDVLLSPSFLKPCLGQKLIIYFPVLPFSPHPSLMLPRFISTRWELNRWIHQGAIPSGSGCRLLRLQGLVSVSAGSIFPK